MEKDLQKKGYFYAPERFADLINGLICAGKEIVSPSDLTDMDSQTGFFLGTSGNKERTSKKKQRYRDLIRKAAFGVNFMIVGIENQEEVNYLMPLRTMTYDDPAYRELEEETYDTIAEYTKTIELMQVKQYRKKGGKVNMCGAITELIQEGRMEGIEQGIKALIETSMELGSTKEETMNRLVGKLSISSGAAEKYLRQFWR